MAVNTLGEGPILETEGAFGRPLFFPGPALPGACGANIGGHRQKTLRSTHSRRVLGCLRHTRVCTAAHVHSASLYHLRGMRSHDRAISAEALSP